MPDLLPWPFSLPGRLLDQLGYAGAIEAFESPASARPVHLEAAELPPAPLDTLPGVPAFGVEPRRRQVLHGVQAGGGGDYTGALAELRYLAARPLPTTDEDLAHVRRAPLPQRSPSGWLPASACQAAVSFG